MIKEIPFLMDNYPECPICNNHFTQHVPTILCSTCSLHVHVSCLPTYSDVDILSINENPNHWSCTKCLSIIFPFFEIEETPDFINTILYTNSPIPFDIESMLYDPFDNNQDGGALDDLDPDDGYYNLQNVFNSETCKYQYPDQLSSRIHSWTTQPNISILHHNVRSLRQNFTRFNTLLDTLDHTFSVLGLTETWLKSYNASLFNIDGYTHEFLTRENKTGGGVSLFINSDLSYVVRTDLNHQDDDIEMLWV